MKESNSENDELILLHEPRIEKNGSKCNCFSIKVIILTCILVSSLTFVGLFIGLSLNLFISLGISFFIIILILLIFFKLFMRRLEKSGYSENWHELYGEQIVDIPYFRNEIIINSFKVNGDNFNEEIGEVYNGRDYRRNKRNYFDLYIPYLSLEKKNKYNGIMLFIHGGGWKFGSKENIEFFCSRYAKYGYITATMNHSFLNSKYEGYSIFRIMDEITSCIQSIKDYLNDRGFDVNKLELAICGTSSGAHLGLLYGYSIKNCPIPLKFLINIVGPLSLEPKYWYKIRNDEILENIGPVDIDDALKQKKIVEMFENESKFLNLMNDFIGGRFTSIELNEMIENKKIKTDNERYKQMIKIAKYTFPINYINGNVVPTLCEYGGKDSMVGVAHYSYLKKLSEQYGNKVELVYMKYGGHVLDSYDTEDGMNAIREMHYQILKFAKTYFTFDE